uniref:Uncharacterized protein n=1 Tax=Oryza rufipogon TaxID=4529 RepID=A0A0E0R1X0_ORYRU
MARGCVLLYVYPTDPPRRGPSEEVQPRKAATSVRPSRGTRRRGSGAVPVAFAIPGRGRHLSRRKRPGRWRQRLLLPTRWGARVAVIGTNLAGGSGGGGGGGPDRSMITQDRCTAPAPCGSSIQHGQFATLHREEAKRFLRR